MSSRYFFRHPLSALIAAPPANGGGIGGRETVGTEAR